MTIRRRKRRPTTLPRGVVVLRPPRRIDDMRITARLSPSGPGFLTLERMRVRNVYGDGTLSPPYRFEVLHRKGVDAVAIMPFYFRGRARRVMVLCKIGFRPGLQVRGSLEKPLRDRREYDWVIEAVAGSLEPRDRGERGISGRARKELLEETGFRPRHGRTVDLGAGFFPSHGQSTEKIHLRAFEIDPRAAGEGRGDGSVNEFDSGTLAIEASRVLAMCRAGWIEDPKLEVGVSRLMRALVRRVGRKG